MTEEPVKRKPRLRLVVSITAVEVDGLFSTTDRVWAREEVVIPNGSVEGVDLNDVSERVINRARAMSNPASEPGGGQEGAGR